MPTYEYEHVDQACSYGRQFEYDQSINDWDLTKCPYCGQPVRKLLSAPTVKIKRSDAELRDLGITKLVRVDDGIYENVTARDGESRFMDRRKPETLPHLHKTIKD